MASADPAYILAIPPELPMRILRLLLPSRQEIRIQTHVHTHRDNLQRLCYEIREQIFSYLSPSLSNLKVITNPRQWCVEPLAHLYGIKKVYFKGAERELADELITVMMSEKKWSC